MDVKVFHSSRLPSSARKPSLLEAACRAALGPAARRRGELSLVFLDRRAMRAINKRFLGHDYDTDVIAFPYPAAPGGPFGDVFVSVPQARRQAAALGHSLLAEVLTLAIHGTLHLVGYSDEKAKDRRRMFARQDALLRRVLRDG